MSVHATTLTALESFRDPNAPDKNIAETPEGQIALVLAAALDDRAGVQNLAATAARLQTTLAEMRERYEPKKKGRLELLRGGSEQTAG